MFLQVNELFFSIQGESSFSGWPTVFVRTKGCNIRCHYCDTKYSYYEGGPKSFEDILKDIGAYKTKHVCVTGGEPMAQKYIHEFLKLLCDKDYIVSLETNGFFDTSGVDKRVVKVIDVKTPGSGEEKSFNYKNLDALSANDQIKFVICNEKDYLWSKNFVLDHKLHNKCTVFFSPAFETMPPQTLSEKILKDFLPVRLQLQLHKYIWNPQQRGV
ncbi:MAG: radical SAM protein [Oligoflexia bacterium]|nr:radical SAM protein [Oligoflexia bacterium]